MGDRNFRFRYVLLDLTGDIVDFRNVVEQVEYLTLTASSRSMTS